VRLYLLLPFVGACFIFAPPASRSPLKEKLGPLSNNELEGATRYCFKKSGWKVDQLASDHGGVRVLHGKNGNDEASLYLQAEGTTPRITGDLVNGSDAFWACLASGPHEDKPEDDKVEPDKVDSDAATAQGSNGDADAATAQGSKVDSDAAATAHGSKVDAGAAKAHGS
jgi:hypothetical protein